MKHLENKEILSDEILNAINIIISRTPDAVFGGSIALNAIGLINRPIKDIDLFFKTYESLTKNNLITNLDGDEAPTSDTVTNTNGKAIQRVGMKIQNVKICVFKVDNEELQHSLHAFSRDGKSYTIRIQNVNYVIEAKKAYAERNDKHKIDLDNAFAELERIIILE